LVRSVFEILLYLGVIGYVFAWGQKANTWIPNLEDKVTDQLAVTQGVAKTESLDDESIMLSLINLERAKQGLTLLRLDPELTLIAREYSRAMLERGFFSHQSPDGGFASDRLRERGIQYRILAENIARSMNARAAHRDLMDSPGHRANILRKEFRRVGVGIADGGIYGRIFTEIFAD